MIPSSTLVLQRTSMGPSHTCGYIQVANTRIWTLELPWKNNTPFVSCIPDGRYQLTWNVLSKYGRCLQLVGVPDRDLIEIHRGNTIRDTNGCILIAMKRSVLEDRRVALFDSREAFAILNFYCSLQDWPLFLSVNDSQ